MKQKREKEKEGDYTVIQASLSIHEAGTESIKEIFRSTDGGASRVLPGRRSGELIIIHPQSTTFVSSLFFHQTWLRVQHVTPATQKCVKDLIN